MPSSDLPSLTLSSGFTNNPPTSTYALHSHYKMEKFTTTLKDIKNHPLDRLGFSKGPDNVGLSLGEGKTILKIQLWGGGGVVVSDRSSLTTTNNG